MSKDVGTQKNHESAEDSAATAWDAELPPRVQQAIRSFGFAITLKAGDMDGLAAVNLARDGEIIARELRRQLRGRKVRP